MPLRDASKLRFEDKKKWFRLNVERFRIPWTAGADMLRVDRDDLLKTSVKNIKKCNLFKVYSCWKKSKFAEYLSKLGSES